MRSQSFGPNLEGAVGASKTKFCASLGPGDLGAQKTTQGPNAGCLGRPKPTAPPALPSPRRAVCPIAWSLRAPRSLRGSVQLTLESSKRVLTGKTVDGPTLGRRRITLLGLRFWFSIPRLEPWHFEAASPRWPSDPAGALGQLAVSGQVTPGCPRPLAMPTFCDHVADGLWTNLALLCVRHLPISRLPETPLPGKLAPRPFALVSDVVIINLKSLLSKGNQDLVPNCDAGFRVTAA
jgi:hypothetical protein